VRCGNNGLQCENLERVHSRQKSLHRFGASDAANVAAARTWGVRWRATGAGADNAGPDRLAYHWAPGEGGTCHLANRFNSRRT
jgi:hypothetical protein